MTHPPIPPSVIGLVLMAIGLVALLGAGKVPLRYNFRNLLVRWKITVLTALAFTLVVTLLLIMLAFMNGMTRLIERSGQPGNVIVLSSGATDELISHLSPADAREVDTQPGILHDPQGRPLCSREVYVVVNQSLAGAPGERPRRRLIQLRGIEEPELAAGVRGLELRPGGVWFSPAGVRALTGAASEGHSSPAIEAVVGEGIAREWRLRVGDVFELGPRFWMVVGILKSVDSAFGSEVWAKRQLVGEVFGKENAYTSLLLRTADAATAQRVSEELTQNFKKAALRALPERDYYAKLADTNQGLLGATYVIAIVMAVGGVFGVMNTMFAAISQRTGDIGLLRILGFARWRILVSFFVESLMLALVSGGIGCALGLLANGWSATSFLGGRSLVFTLVVDSDTLLVGVLFTVSMGGLGGLLPAVSAMRVKPLESLR